MKTENSKRHALLRFQSGIFAFQNDQHDVLCDDEFVEELIKYLFSLSQHGYIDVATRVLEKLGDYISRGKPCSRNKSLYILSAFTEKIGRDELSGFADVISRIRAL